MSFTQIQVGPQVLSDGATPTLRGGKGGDGIISQLNARYYENTYRGNTFGVSYPAAALAVASATATGAFALWNPPGSNVNLSILDFEAVLVSFTASTNPLQVGLVAVPNQSPTSISAGNTPNSMLIGSSNVSSAKPYVAGTLVGASTTAFRLVGSWYADLAAGDVTGYFKDEIGGAVIIGPNSGLCVVAITTVPTNTAAISLTWAETEV